jgi:hypothetical protein
MAQLEVTAQPRPAGAVVGGSGYALLERIAVVWPVGQERIMRVLDRVSNGRLRSAAGAALGLALVAVLAGVMGCLELPAPVGDPEQARIDPAMTGVWEGRDVESGGTVSVWIFRPWDRRTWRLEWYELDWEASKEDALNPSSSMEGGAATGTDSATLEGSNDQDDEPVSQLVEIVPDARKWQLEGCDVSVHKAWTATLAGARFLSIEVAGSAVVSIPDEAEWLVLRIDSVGERLSMRFIDPDFEGFDFDGEPDDGTDEGVELGFEERRARVEEVITRHLKDPELYAGEGEPDEMTRVLPSRMDEVEDVLSRCELVANHW